MNSTEVLTCTYGLFFKFVIVTFPKNCWKPLKNLTGFNGKIVTRITECVLSTSSTELFIYFIIYGLGTINS